MFGLPLGGARAAATPRKSSPQKQPAKCLPIGRLGGWAEGAINKPAKQTPTNKRPNGHTSSREMFCCFSLGVLRLGGAGEVAPAKGVRGKYPTQRGSRATPVKGVRGKLPPLCGWVGGRSEYKKACEADTTP